MVWLTEVTEGSFTVKRTEFSPVPVNAVCIACFTLRLRTSFAGQDRVCAASRQVTGDETLANN